MVFAAGDILLASDLNADLGAAAAIADGWIEFVATWAAASVNPVINNGTITAHYLETGDLIFYKGAIVPGGTTTFGTGVYNITLPLAASLGNRNTGIVTLNDSSASTNDRAGAVEFLSSTTFRIVANGQVAPTVPFTFASGDAIRWFICYQPA